MHIHQAQQDMQDAYYSGAPGMLVSGVVWLIAGIVALLAAFSASMATLFFGGMTIVPLSIVACKLLGRSGKHQSDNPLSSLALESTMLLFCGLFIAFVVSFSRPELFFPIMLLTIGGRYLVFSTLYGLRFYWLLGALLCVAGMLLTLTTKNIYLGAFIGGAIEVIGAITLFLRSRSESTQVTSQGN